MPALVENSPANVVYANPLHVPGAGAQFITPQGDPIPPSELVDVVREAGEKSGLTLTVVWVKGAWGTSSFAVKQQWREDDKRWERVRCGECDPNHAFDVTFRFPAEMRTGDMVGMIRGKFGFVKDPRKEAEALIARAQKLMEQATGSQVDAMVEKGTRRILDDSDHQRLVSIGAERAHPMVSGADFSDREPKRLL